MTSTITYDSIRIFISRREGEITEFTKKIQNEAQELSAFSEYFEDPYRHILLVSAQDCVSEFEHNARVTLDTLSHHDAILFSYLDNEGNATLLSMRLDPEAKYDWIKVCEDFLINIMKTDTDSNGYYRWGQLAPQTGEYLCIDCGFILELQAGEMFPICEVCVSGDPSAADAKSDEGFWELL